MNNGLNSVSHSYKSIKWLQKNWNSTSWKDSFYESFMCFLELDSYNPLIHLFCIPWKIIFKGFGIQTVKTENTYTELLLLLIFFSIDPLSEIQQKETKTKRMWQRGHDRNKFENQCLNPHNAFKSVYEFCILCPFGLKESFIETVLT